MGKCGILEPKNAKIQNFWQICSLDFSKILCDDRYSEGRKLFYYYFYQFFI